MTKSSREMDEIFGPEGLVARHHPNYEYRPGQVEMAETVRDTLENGGVALVEAGTGTGKTLAYLIPAIAAGRRVMVSTATKNLQEQLYKKDIPFLQETLPREFAATCMKGRSNYVCLLRLKRAEQNPILSGLDEVDSFDQIRQWAAETETGDRAELTDLPEDISFWPQIDARAEICLGQKCQEFDACFITRMRQRALESDVVIVNHHLFFADLAMRGGEYGAVLPDYSTVIFDEAHELEDVAATYFGVNISNYRIVELIQDAQKLVLTDTGRAGEVARALARLGQRSETFWLAIAHADIENSTLVTSSSPRNRSRADSEDAGYSRSGALGERGVIGMLDGRYVIGQTLFVQKEPAGGYKPTLAGEAYMALTNSVNSLIAALGVVQDAPPEVDNIVRRAQGLKFDLEFVVMGDDPTFVYWLEKRGRGLFLYATPIDVSGMLTDKLFSTVHSAVLTSATLTAGGGFDFIKSRLGVREAREVVVESHFEFENQAVLYLPARMPDPRTREFMDASVEEIVRILEATEGRAFVLFTSVASMRDDYERVRGRIDYPVLIQGQGSKTGLLDRFRRTQGAVLFATSSFWQGVDVQGDALSCVIIQKLPFAVPTDPVVAARQRYIDSEGGNSFYDYSVPEAIITLKQGLGRLIRSTGDRGVLSVLDPRLRTKGYGRLFLQSLPPCRLTDNITDAASVLVK
ncbi:MAG TPA: helicase C-terminal domain-containing protein [Blastocatellia bacterium]|nr:helicase C-terminal domain-containing protein [Blastocatellia bacterium]